MEDTFMKDTSEENNWIVLIARNEWKQLFGMYKMLLRTSTYGFIKP